jgi:diguanylate cyclase (GGDEF)-like protein
MIVRHVSGCWCSSVLANVVRPHFSLLTEALAKVNMKKIPDAYRWLLSIGAPTLICLIGWGQVITQNHQLQAKTIRTHQTAQLKTLQVVAQMLGQRIIQARIQQHETPRPIDIDQTIVNPLLAQLSQPDNRPGEFYAFAISADRLNAPPQFNPLPIAELRRFAPAPPLMPLSPPDVWSMVQLQPGMTPPPINGDGPPTQPGVINTWTAMTLYPNTPQQETWVVGSANQFSAIMQESGSDRQITRSLMHMAIFTIGMIALATVMLRLQQQQRADATAVVAQLMDSDPLTGLANRRKLQQRGSEALRQLQDQQSLALVILNLDRFRPINDLLGPDAGDELLIKVSARLQSCLRKEDLLARLSGDEFAVLLHNTNDYHAQICAERLLRELDHPFWINGRANHLSGSIGIATTKNSAITFSQFLSQSDAAMARTKHQQQGGYTLFNPSMYSETLDQLSLEADLRRAIERHELRVYYQPIVDLQTRQTKGYEALVRWQHRQRGLLHPGAFLPLAAAIGWTISMERWVLRQACTQMAAWYRQADDLEADRPTVSVNISAQHLTHACLPHYDLVGYIETILQETDWPAHCLILEITEDALINSAEAVAARLAEIQKIGVRISLDDFGTGYSSLSYLQHFPVDILKIDKSFIRLIHDRMQDGEIVKTIIALANSLGVSTIAEGIETEEQLKHLQSLQCQYGQGFLFSQPLKHLGPDRRVQAIPPTSIMNSLMPDVAGMDEPRSAVIAPIVAPVVAPVVEQRRR